MQPYFSIITPVLNGHKFADVYIKSLQKQTWLDWEAIIIDDGSTDNTLEIFTKVAATDSRFRVEQNDFQGPKLGPATARNKGLHMAKGIFLCFLDIDDYWLPTKLENQVKATKNGEALMTYGSYIRSPHGKQIGKIYHVNHIISTHFLIKFMNPVPMLTACINREVAYGIEFSNIHHEDYIYWHRIVHRLEPRQISVQSSAEAIYQTHDESVSSNKLKAAIWIWKCYRALNYSYLSCLCAYFIRGLTQLVSSIGTALSKPVIIKIPRI